MNELIETENVKIEDMIYEFRGKQVMIDRDLAKLYQVETRVLIQKVKRNVERFPIEFCFQLSNEEFLNWKSQIVMSKNDNIGLRRNPYAFTEQGVAMLSAILKSDVAIHISIEIINAFVAMRHYVGNNGYRLSNAESKIIEHDTRIKLLEETFNKFKEKENTNEVYYNGETYNAYSRIIDIFNKAKNELIIIDSYADKIVLDIIRKIKVKVFLITKDSDRLSNLDIEKYKSEYDNLKVIRNNSFHDRYFILDKKDVYHSGASINNAGTKTFSINKLTDIIVIKEFVNEVLNIIKSNE
jgi:hypothetical protein